MCKLTAIYSGLIAGCLLNMITPSVMAATHAENIQSLAFGSMQPIGTGVQQLQQEEDARMRAIQQRDPLESAHNYGIIKHLNNIKTTGPVATHAERDIIVQSVIATALRVADLTLLMRFYLADSLPKATKASRLAYLAISILTHDKRDTSTIAASNAVSRSADIIPFLNESKDNQPKISDAETRILRGLLATYQSFVEKLYPAIGKNIAIKKEEEKEDKWAFARSPEVPSFYNEILQKIDPEQAQVERIVKNVHTELLASPYVPLPPIALLQFCTRLRLPIADTTDLLGVWALSEKSENLKQHPKRLGSYWSDFQAYPKQIPIAFAVPLPPSSKATSGISHTNSKSKNEATISTQTKKAILEKADKLVPLLEAIAAAAPKVYVEGISDKDLEDACSEQRRATQKFADLYDSLLEFLDDQGNLLPPQRIHEIALESDFLRPYREQFEIAISNRMSK